MLEATRYQGKRVWNALVRESLGCWGLGESLSDQGGHIGIIHSCSITFLSHAPLHSGVTAQNIEGIASNESEITSRMEGANATIIFAKIDI